MLAALVVALPAGATEVNVIGLFPGKAVVVIDRAAPRTISAGQRTPEGVLLIAADSRSATLEIDGKRQVLELGQHAESAALTGALQSVTLASDGSGHFTAEGQVNGARMRFLVDTGATLVTLREGAPHPPGSSLGGSPISSISSFPPRSSRVSRGSVPDRCEVPRRETRLRARSHRTARASRRTRATP